MSPTPVQITRRPEATAATTSALSQHRRPEPTGIVITTVEQVSAGNQRGCGDDNPYN
ncbi:hypothetical protein Acy02nite_68820 [Actinoplanes cyaneus]|uniref:Uncharacterized protein n=1 Tax=Actinoplanes cyaneus TaxID=52696 RepID=A0A919IPV5_9ACTN|nr:hypothetical protein [Actinoplanes cyaneus]MCW2139069.1 hypothetical protein [Actinoplanes cyaneus]GID69001.1 hypothetical protein Acy02nite_68820 [Actinoplanes cyaneus]